MRIKIYHVRGGWECRNIAGDGETVYFAETCADAVDYCKQQDLLVDSIRTFVF